MQRTMGDIIIARGLLEKPRGSTQRTMGDITLTCDPLVHNWNEVGWGEYNRLTSKHPIKCPLY